MFARNLLRFSAALLFVVLASPAAHAQLFRAYLASDGSDANPCTLPQPCRLLPAALAAVASGGEIWMLDSANYNTGTVAITKSVTILAIPGAVGSVVANASPALSITTPGLRIALRNLVIVPVALGAGTDGVRLFAASELSVEDCVFSGLPSISMHVQGAGAKARIGNSIFRHLNHAILVEGGAITNVFASQFIGVQSGVTVFSGNTLSTSASVSDSNFAGGSTGVKAETAGGGFGGARVAIIRSTFTNLTHALWTTTSNDTLASISVSQTLVSGNEYGYFKEGFTTINTLGNNHFFNNVANSGTLTQVAPN